MEIHVPKEMMKMAEVFNKTEGDETIFYLTNKKSVGKKKRFIGSYHRRFGFLFINRSNRHYFKKFDGFGVNKYMVDYVMEHNPDAKVVVTIDGSIDRNSDFCTHLRPKKILSGSEIVCKVSHLVKCKNHENRGEKQYILQLCDSVVDFTGVDGKFSDDQRVQKTLDVV